MNNVIDVRHSKLLATDQIRRGFDIYAYVLNKCGGELTGRTGRGYRNVVGSKLCGLAVREDRFVWHGLGIEGDALDLVAMLRQCQWPVNAHVPLDGTRPRPHRCAR